MKDIGFIPKNKDADILVPMPEPARQVLPDWYKSMPAFKENKMRIDSLGAANLTQKMCVPFGDALGFGYIQRTWCDIYINAEGDEGLRYNFSGPPEIINVRPDHDREYADSFYNIEFFWKLQWVPKLPKGYSMLYTHPLNREDLPFYTFSGVVESDRFIFEDAGNHPFLIKKGFSGIIPAGTPMFQMIPFKRDNWKSSRLPVDEDLETKNKKLRRNFWGTYKKDFWVKKTFK